jgi:hypothetical protein
VVDDGPVAVSVLDLTNDPLMLRMALIPVEVVEGFEVARERVLPRPGRGVGRLSFVLADRKGAQTGDAVLEFGQSSEDRVAVVISPSRRWPPRPSRRR